MKQAHVLGLIAAHLKGDDRSFNRFLQQILATDSKLAAEVKKLENTRNLTAFPQSKHGTPLIRVQKNLVDLESLVLSAETKADLDRLVLEFGSVEKLVEAGYEPCKKVLFYGPSGCGKTAAAGGLAQALGLPLVAVRFDSLLSSYLGESMTNLNSVFDWLAKNKAVCLIDEFDSISRSRSGDDVGEAKRLVNSLILELDRYSGESLLIAATNYEGSVDLAVKRRFELLHFTKPLKRQRFDFVESMIGGLVDYGAISSFVEATAERSYAEIQFICDRACKGALLADEPLTNDHLSAELERFDRLSVS